MPVLYNTTFIVAPALEASLVDFLKTFYLPRLRQIPELKDIRAMRIDNPDEEDNTANYAIQFAVSDEQQLITILPTLAQELEVELTLRFGDSVMGFSTTMELLDL